MEKHAQNASRQIFKKQAREISDTVDTHMFISVLAYHILHIIEYRLRQKGDHRKWRTIQNVLKTHERLTIAYKSKDENGNIR